MINLDDFATDPKAEAGGKVFTLKCGVKMTIARANSPGYIAKVQELMQPYVPTLRMKKPLPPGAFEDITVKAMASGMIRGWEPFEYMGAEFPYSPENAEILLLDERLHDIREEIAEIAGSADSYREQLLVEAEKN